MSDTRFEERVRDGLRVQADTQTFPARGSGEVAVRARRRLLRNGVVVATVAIVAGLIALASVPHVEGSVPVHVPMPIGPKADGKITVSRGQDLFVMNENGSDVANLTGCEARPCGVVDSLAWSPNGTMLVFSRGMASKFRLGQDEGPLWLINGDGSSLRRVTDCTPTVCEDGGGVWSPDGTRIAFVRSVGNWRPGSGIYTVAPDGSGLSLLAPGGDDPVWSPDGTKMAFEAVEGLQARMYVIDADGSDRRLLVEGSGFPSGPGPYRPTWSPDSSQIAYMFQPGGPHRYVYELRVIGLDGSNARTRFRSECCVDNWLPPLWSPDGSSIAFGWGTRVGSRTGCFLIDPDGNHLRLLGRVWGAEGAFSWSPSGKRLLATVRARLVTIGADGSGPTPVQAGYPFRVAWQPIPLGGVP